MNKQTKFKQTEIGMIPEDWEVEMAGNYCKHVTDGTHASPKKRSKGKYLITSKHLKQNRLDFDNAYFISEEDYDEINKRSKVEQFDILFSMIGTVGEIYREKSNKIDYAIKNVGLFKFDADKNKSCWFFYWLKSDLGQEYIQSRQAGSTQQYLTLEALRKFPVAYPRNQREQSAIVKILSSLDDKIELNQKMNKTLEEIGQAIFKHWFVDFEFPNEEGKPYKSSGGEMVYNEELGKEIPKGWKVETLGNLIIRNKEKVTNKKGWKEENIIDLSTMPQFSICLDSFQKGEKFDSNVFKLREMDILFGSIRPYFGKAGFSPINGVVTGTIFSYLPRDNNHYAYILFLTTGKDFIDFTVAFSKGTKMPIIGWDDFCSYKLVIPEGGELIERFNDILMPLIIKIKVNIQQIQTLSQARDSLLPKLMSGKIRVPLEEKE